jgi:hypothetical protein
MQCRSEPALKLQVYLPASLKHEIERAAEARGQSLSTFVARTLSTAMQPTGNPQAGK